MNRTVNQSPITIKQNFPVFPSFLARVIEMVPQKIHSTPIVKILNTILQEPRLEGDLDFLDGQNVSVEVTDLKLRFALSLQAQKLVSCRWKEKDHLNLRGNLYDFLLLANRQEDADTLFFQRRLKMSGDTDLGLEVKNLLDGLELESIRYYPQIEFTLKHILTLYTQLDRGKRYLQK